MATKPPGDRDQMLTDRERWLERLVEATSDAVISIDDLGRIVGFNSSAERMFGRAGAEVMGKNVSILMPEPHSSAHDGYLGRYRRTGEGGAVGRIRGVEGLHADGHTFPIELSVTEVSVEGGPRFTAFIRDLSERERLQAELSDKKRLAAIGTTAASLAHEVANPLNNLRLTVRLARRRLQTMGIDDESLSNSLTTIESEVDRLTELLDEFRLLSRRQELHLASCSVRELVESVCSRQEPELIQRKIDVRTDLADPLPPIRADAARLEQVLLNLCKNAMEAMPEGGHIEVSAVHHDDAVVLEVRDDGVGVPSGVDPFEPFNTTKEQGTGLGLPVSKRIVAAHGGSIEYRARKERGTTFRVTLPIGGPRPIERG